MPQFSDKTLRVIASNWQLSGIVRVLTGSYLTMTTGVDSALIRIDMGLTRT